MQKITNIASTNSRYQDIVLCTFKGTVYAFARDMEQVVPAGGDNIVFNVLDLDIASTSDDLDWTGFAPVSFPPTLRPVGISLIEVDIHALSDVIAPVTDQPFRVVSDDTYLYVFRKSTTGGLFVNRMLPGSETNPDSDGQEFSLTPAWEVRFRESGKIDIPANDKDVLSYRNTDNVPFIEPTLELNFSIHVADEQEGPFTDFNVCLVPGTGGGFWHIFITNYVSQISHYSVKKGDGVAFDVSGQLVSPDGLILPADVFTFATEVTEPGKRCNIPYAPGLCLFTQRETVARNDGDDLITQKALRLALSQNLGINATATGDRSMAFLDIGVAADGQINTFPNQFQLPEIQPSNYALDFDDFAYVALPNMDGSLELAGSFSFSLWFKPASLPVEEQLLIGDNETDPAKRSAFLSMKDNGKLVFGFGAGDIEVRTTSANRVLSKNVWHEIEATFTTAESGNGGTFELLVNGESATLDTVSTESVPVGAAVSSIGALNSGGTGTYSSITIIDKGTIVADLPFNAVDFEAAPATTPDESGLSNDGEVNGARMSPSDSPAVDPGGKIFIDQTSGLRTYYGEIRFVKPRSQTALLNSADGLLHLYYADAENNFDVVQMNLDAQRATFSAGWSAGGDEINQTGTFDFVAQRAGTVMNDASVAVSPQPENPGGFVDIEFTSRGTSADDQAEDPFWSETWQGVPSWIENAADVLAGNFASDPFDASVLAGARVFFDIDGRYPQAQVPIDVQEKFAALNFVSRFPSDLPLSDIRIEPGEDAGHVNVRLEFQPQKTDWPDAVPFTENWSGVPVHVRGFVDALNAVTQVAVAGTEVETSLQTVNILGGGQGIGNSISFILHTFLTDVEMSVADGADPSLCTVELYALVNGVETASTLNAVPRQLDEFAEVLNGHSSRYDYATLAEGDFAEILQLWVPIAAGALGSVQNRARQPLSSEGAEPGKIGNIRTAASFFSLFQSGRLASSNPVPVPYEKAAAIYQSGRDKDGASLTRGSQIFQGLSKTRPTNGAVALLQGTSGLSGGTAALSEQGTNGGWIRQPPQTGLNFEQDQTIEFDLTAPNIDSLDCDRDMSAEAWIRPKSDDTGQLGAGSQRLLTFHKQQGSADTANSTRYAMGLENSYSFQTGEDPKCRISTGYSLAAGCDFSFELWVKFQDQEDDRWGFLTSVASKKEIKASDQNGLAIRRTGSKIRFQTPDETTINVESNSDLETEKWTYIVATLKYINDQKDQVEASLYINGEFDSSGIFDLLNVSLPEMKDFGIGKPYNNGSAAIQVQFNGASLWTRALLPGEISAALHQPLSDRSPSLAVRWKLTETSGTIAKNYSNAGDAFDGVVTGTGENPWLPESIYTAFYFAYGRDAFRVLGSALADQWNYIGVSYKHGTALNFSGKSCAKTEPTEYLDFESGGSVEFWAEPVSIQKNQVIMSRHNVYAVELLPQGCIKFSLETNNGVIEAISDRPIGANELSYVAIVFETNARETGLKSDDKAKPPKYDTTIDFYFDGDGAGQTTRTYDAQSIALSAKNPLVLAQDYDGTSQLSGLLGQVRLWSRALTKTEVRNSYASRAVPSDRDGLLAAWDFAEMSGLTAKDQDDALPLTLSNVTLWRLLDRLSGVGFVVNGEAASTVQHGFADEIGGFETPQFTVGMPTASTEENHTPGIHAEVDDIRLWNMARTVEQMTDEQHRALSGREVGLAGYWPLNTGSGLKIVDATGRGNDGTFGPQAPVWGASTAPISNEAEPVFNTLGGVPTEYNRSISGSPAIIEYGDIQTDAYGTTFSVMKRCYMAPIPDGLMAVTGYKVGDLDIVHVGQVQTQPKIIGYFEGAPPIPSENQTMPMWAGDITEYHEYATATSASVTVEQDITYSISGEREIALEGGVSGSLGVGVSVDGDTSVGIGAEIGKTIAKLEGKAGLTVENSLEGVLSNSVVQSFETTKVQTSSLTPGGAWEPEDLVLNPTIGRRYIPDNLGTAVVKSGVADLYASRIKSTGQLVKLTVVPNPDIPEDVNLIDFPIDPTYIKNGTLDGQVGLVKDPDTGVSYFRPLEAYRMRRQIEKQQADIEAYFDQVSTFGIAVFNYGNLAKKRLPENPSYDWSEKRSKRGIANTYVWTAGGGTHSETMNFADSYSESWGTLRSLALGAGAHGEGSAIVVAAGPYFEADISGNITFDMQGTKTRENSNAVTLDINAAPDWFLSAPAVDAVDGVSYSSSPAPGKVDNYRYMAFFLPPSTENAEHFADGLIDPLWLQQSQSPNASALRQARASDNGSWRVLYRVTYVSRIPPIFQASPDMMQPPALLPPANIEENVVLTSLVSSEIAAVGANMPEATEVGRALLHVLGESPEKPGVLGTSLSWWVGFLQLAEDYNNPQAKTLSGLREDSLQYMLDGYETLSISSETDVRMFATR